MTNKDMLFQLEFMAMMIQCGREEEAIEAYSKIERELRKRTKEEEKEDGSKSSL